MPDERTPETPIEELEALLDADVSRLGPYQDFATAARAVFARLCGLEGDPVEQVLARLLSTILVNDQHAPRASDRAQRAEVDSLVDPLTGLANRRAWIRLLSTEEDRCRRHGIDTSVLVIDLDDLKEVNDALGHAAGDDVLIRAARAIVDQTRAHDAVVRLGGDEFAVLAAHCPEPDAEVLTRRLVDALEAERISASVGLATRAPDRGLHRAWEEADSAMYRVKRRRKLSAAESMLRIAPGGPGRARHTSTDPGWTDPPRR